MTTWVAIPVLGGPEDGAVRQVDVDRLADFETVVLHDGQSKPVQSAEVYVVRWQRAYEDGIAGRWVAVALSLIADEVEEYRRNREPETVPPDDPTHGIRYCADGHAWGEWILTPKGNRMRSCLKCPLTQGQVV